MPLLLLVSCGGGGTPRANDIASSATTSTAPTTTVPVTTTTAPPPTQPTVSSDPTALGRQLATDEQTIRTATTPRAALVDAARRQQLAYRSWSRHPEWDATVMALMPASLVSAVHGNIDARRQFVTMAASTNPSDTLPAWRIQEPLAAEQLVAFYKEAERAFGVGWSYLAAINLVETGFGRIVGLSTAGAQGPMQFLPATWERYGAGGDITSPHDSILGAARYLAANDFTRGQIDSALKHYNRSPQYVQAVKDYAAIIAAEPATFAAYHAWDIYYFTTMGDVHLPVGYESATRTPVADYLASHPR